MIHAPPSVPRALPTGTVAFLMTDVEGSTVLWDRHEPAMRAAMETHDRIADEVVAAHSGRLVKPRGEGDSLFCVFTHVPSALAAAATMVRAFAREEWPLPEPLRVRMAVHAGEVQVRDDDYYGPTVNRAARIRAAGHGGQILVGQAAAVLALGALPPDTRLEDLGERRLKDLLRPERVHQLSLAEVAHRFPPLRTVDIHPNNLPAQLTSFVGRTKELSRLRERLLASRCLTISGAGGGGKTRLAVQLAAEAVERFPEGIWFVDFARSRPGEHLPQRVADAVALLPESSGTNVESLVDALAPHCTLLVLDNCEALPLAEMVRDLLAGAPGVTVLATSREPLGVPGERLFALPPLDYPEPGTPVADLMDCDAVRLFVERAGLARDDFALTERNGDAVAELCRRLDGLPLAIEQAAAGVATLEPAEILQDLATHLDIPRSGVGEKHRTMRACIDWSVDRLTPDERIVFRRLAVFAGGCEARAVRAVVADEGLSAVRVSECLRVLVLKSLVVNSDGSEGRRHRLLEPIREVATELLLREEAAPEEIAARADRHYRGLLLDLGPRVETADQVHALGVLDDEAPNVRRLLNRAAASDLPDLVWAIGDYATRRGRLAELCVWHERALADGVFVSTARRAGLMNKLGSVYWKMGRYGDARRAYEEVTASFDASDPEYRSAYARSCNNLALLAVEEDRLEEARDLYTSALAEFRELGQEAHAATVLSNLGPLEAGSGRPEVGVEQLEDALDVFERLGNRAKVARVHSNLVGVLVGMGRHEEAAEHAVDAFRIWRGLLDPSFVGEGLLDVARILLAENRPLDAAVALGAADSIVASCGTKLDRFQTAYRAEAVRGVEAALDRRERRSALARGASLSPAMAVELAFGLCSEVAGM